MPGPSEGTRLSQKGRQAHARAGADIIAPSDMMNGRVAAIRTALDKARRILDGRRPDPLTQREVWRS